jgi:drug/metabolite transporter (DMT)-like permease
LNTTRNISAAYLGVIAIWSTTPLGIQWSTLGSSFTFAVMLRMLIGWTICVAALRWMRMALPRDANARRMYLTSGLSMFVAMLCSYWGAQHIPSGLISVIFGLSPLATGLFATLWLRSHELSPLRIAGLALSLAGLWLIFGQSWSSDKLAVAGIAAVLFGMLTQSLGLVWIKRIGNQRTQTPLTSLAITTGSLSVGTPLFVLAWLIVDAGNLPISLSWRATAAIVYLGLFGSVVGFTLYYYVIQKLDAGRVALIMLITPVAALLLGQTLNHETIPASGWAGIALIGMGLVLYEWQALRKLGK